MTMIAEPIIESQIRTNNLLDVSVFTDGYYIGSNGQLATNANDHVGDFIPVTPGDDIYYTGIVGNTNSSSINRRLHVYKADKTWIKQLNFAGSLHIGDSWSTHGIVPSNGAYIRVSWGVNDTNVMISVGAPIKYQPYYITPFDVITSVDFTISPTSDPEDGITYTFDVPAAAGNQYGFKFDPILGKMWKTTEHIASYNGETLPGYWQSDRDVYAEGTTPSIGAEVIYTLNEEDIEEYNCTSTAIPLNYRVNYFFVENGLLQELKYYAETFAVQHLTVQNGITYGDTNVLESDIIGWNHAAELIDTKAPIDSPTFTGTVCSQTAPARNDTSLRVATAGFVQDLWNNVAYVENTWKATKNYVEGDYMITNGHLYRLTSSVAEGATLSVNTNIVETTVMDEIKALINSALNS